MKAALAIARGGRWRANRYRLDDTGKAVDATTRTFPDAAKAVQWAREQRQAGYHARTWFEPVTPSTAPGTDTDELAPRRAKKRLRS